MGFITDKGRSFSEAKAEAALTRSPQRQSPARHRLICSICKRMELVMSEEAILRSTPIEYGNVLTYDHLNYFFDRTYDRLAKFGYASLLGEWFYWNLTSIKKGD